MAQKDILEKILMSYADVFADCENALGFAGWLFSYPGRKRMGKK